MAIAIETPFCSFVAPRRSYKLISSGFTNVIAPWKQRAHVITAKMTHYGFIEDYGKIGWQLPLKHRFCSIVAPRRSYKLISSGFPNVIAPRKWRAHVVTANMTHFGISSAFTAFWLILRHFDWYYGLRSPKMNLPQNIQEQISCTEMGPSDMLTLVCLS